MCQGFIGSLYLRSIRPRRLCTMSAKLVVPSQSEHTATVIFLHGLGDTSGGWQPVVPALTLPHVKFVLPTAPIRPVTLWGGQSTTSWTDIFGLSATSPEDEDGFKMALGVVEDIIDEEESNGIPPERIVVGGFSQGGAVALTTLLRVRKRLAGVIALSTWLPLRNKYPAEMREENKAIPLLMCHGDLDYVVQYEWGRKSSETLKRLGVNTEFHTISGMGHSADPQEILLVRQFLNNVLPSK
eukprot:Plantae.Rhodophyta-Purpureofilum_apyrenoidigerum.ctg13118.p1 GENE.Plantae.Rhodophyta-Purpureofilum_apyrenoidigerum.ctg13118~~Plantae.Rhodophyta-Purpureofilum_apyrenoidigerum.ctg13118.p1  ORF type:complete len:241 (+),score=23.57 Plantae.Rhodophyta-Purpureofilum_apyrenoidigerum.ctg13118:172-894(+)